MKKILFALATVITATAASTSFYLATIPNPTDIQKELSNCTNTIMITGATAILGLLNPQDKDNDKS